MNLLNKINFRLTNEFNYVLCMFSGRRSYSNVHSNIIIRVYSTETHLGSIPNDTYLFLFECYESKWKFNLDNLVEFFWEFKGIKWNEN